MESPNKFQNLSKEELIERLSILQEENSEIKGQLTERKKAFQAIFQIGALMNNTQLALVEIFQKTVDLVPASWQYPEITCARIIIGKTEYQTANFKISEWKQSEVISIQNNPDGIIEIYYLEQKPQEFEGPFLKEERDLLKLIAGRLGKIASFKLIEEEFTTIFNESPIAKCVIDLDQDYRFSDVNEVFLKLTGYKRNEIIGKIPSQIGLFKNVKIIEKMLREIHRKGFIENLEYEYVTKDGQAKSTILNSKIIHVNGRNLAVASFIDLTDIKKAQEKLWERNILNATLINTIPYGMDIIDESGTILFANENMKKLFGADIIGQKCWQTYRGNKKQCKQCPLKNGLTAGETKVTVVPGIKGNKVFEISHTNIIFEGQKAILEIFHDITSLKQTEQELGRSEEKFRMLFENMQEGFALHELVKDEDGTPIDYKLIDVNSSFEKILGIPAENAKNTLASELYGTGSAPYLEEYVKVVKNKKPITFETYFPALDKYFHISVNAPNPGYFATIFSDITDRIKNEEKIRESENRFQLIAKNVSDIIWVYNLSKEKFSYVSPSIEKQTGFTVEEATSQTLEKILSPNDYKLLFQLVAENQNRIVQNIKIPTIIYEIQIKHKEGKFIWVEFSAQFQKNSDEEIEIFGISRNIDKRKKAELELIKAKNNVEINELRLKMLFEKSGIGIVTINPEDASFVDFNDQVCSQLGYTREEFSKLTIFDLEAVETKGQTQNRIKKVLETGFADFETKQKRKNGELIDVQVSIRVIKLGNIKYYQSIWRDITNFKKYEQELIAAKEKAEESENRFRTIAELSTEGITIADLEGKYIYVNKTFCNMSGYSREELLQMSVFDMAEPDAEHNSMDVYQSNENISGKKRSLVLRKKDGTHYHTEITGTYIEIENQRLILGSIRDITEIVNYQNDLIAAKEKAEESDSRLKLAVDSGKLGIWDWNVKENTMVWNARMFELYGIPNQIHTNSVETWRNGLHPDDKIKALRAVNKSLQHNKEFNTTFRIVRPDNSVLNIKTNAIVLRDKNGKPARMIGIYRNITKSVKRENELIEARNKALESDRLKSAFLMNMSHEIRTPLNGILGFVNLLQEPGMSEEDRKLFMDVINQSADRLLTTINNIIEISKIESGDLKLYYENIDISKLIRNHSDFFRLHAKEKGIELIISNQIENGANVIQSDKQKLESILTNLIRNAIKFTEKGSVEIGSYLENSYLNLFIKDTGQGIPKDKLKIIFDPFVQADLALARRHEGSGIGLSIVKSYVEALNGTIHVESEVGQGTLFKISIPHIQAN